MNAEPRPDIGPRPLAFIKGAGDLATGVALRLYRAGFAVAMTEIARPTAVRRAVAFAEAVYDGRVTVEGVEGARAADRGDALSLIARGIIPVVVDPEAAVCREMQPVLLVDAIMAKRNLHTSISDAPAVVALGPGFTVGRHAHAVVETKRGHTLGRVIRRGEALANTGIPGEVGGVAGERVLRAPGPGTFRSARQIGDTVSLGEIVGHVDDVPIRTQTDGVLRGVLRSGLPVSAGFKIGDVDPRASRESCFQVSDKALAIAGGVLEAACSLLGGVRFARDAYASAPARDAGATETSEIQRGFQ